MKRIQSINFCDLRKFDKIEKIYLPQNSSWKNESFLLVVAHLPTLIMQKILKIQ